MVAVKKGKERVYLRELLSKVKGDFESRSWGS